MLKCGYAFITVMTQESYVIGCTEVVVNRIWIGKKKDLTIILN